MTVGYEADKVQPDGSVKLQERDPFNNGDWAMVLAEYSISPTWFFTFFTELNYNRTLVVEDEVSGEQSRIDVDNVVYPSATIAFVKDALRVQGGYGRIRGGILCVGGICRPVPASNGFNLGVQYTF